MSDLGDALEALLPDPKPTNNDAYNDSMWWYALGWNECLKEIHKRRSNESQELQGPL